MCQVNKTHSGQFTLSRKRSEQEEKLTRGGGWGRSEVFPLSPSPSFPPNFFLSSLPPRRTPSAERLEQASLLLCDISSPLFQTIQAKGKGGTLFS